MTSAKKHQTSSTWFAVDKDGLAALTARRGKAFVFAELLANAWDAGGVTHVELITERTSRKGELRIRVVDDSEDGFTDLADAYTLFADTAKRSNVAQRGRFNLGEKLSLSLAREATIVSTSGTVRFDAKGRHQSRVRRDIGSEVALCIPMTTNERKVALAEVMTFIAPVRTTVNGEALPVRTPLARTRGRLPTEIAEGQGRMKRTERTVEIAMYAPVEGHPARLFELGIPVCETGDRFDVDVRQKIPLSLERDSVTSTYLRKVRALVLAATSTHLDVDGASEAWVNDALETKNLPQEVVKTVIERRFGNAVVIYDPSDQEANKTATSRGYQVVHGGTFSRAAWENIRASGAMLPAGQVTPTPKPWAEHGVVVKPLEPDACMRLFAEWCKRIATVLLGQSIEVAFYRQFNNIKTAAAYSPGCLQFAVNRLGRGWFDGPIKVEHIDLVLHEFGHHYASDHLSSEYHDALTDLGARLALAVAADPSLLERRTHLKDA